MPPQPLSSYVQVLPSSGTATEIALEELCRTVAASKLPLVSFASGNTFTLFLRQLATAVQNGRLSIDDFLATHLDEYLGLRPETPGGMVHQLVTASPPLGDMLRRGTFLPVPSVDEAAAIRNHTARLRRAGGLKLQFLGLGRNGHVAFNEPGTPFASRFHVAALSESTRDDARSRFLDRPVPQRAVTAGLADILAAERVVLMAFGPHKARAVRAMLEGEVTPACPASILRRHDNVRILLDPEAAAELTRQEAP